MTKEADTIYAPASGGGVGGIAVVRISGPQAGAALRKLSTAPLPPPRQATLTTLLDPDDGEVLDRGLMLWFPAPASFTGEDVAELHIHGGRAVTDAVLQALGVCPGLRLARAGEFTRRAFENGKMDLTAAEALADLVSAETEEQRKQAVRQLGGSLGRLYDGWRQSLLKAQAHLEAGIDFSDQDIPDGLAAGAERSLRAVATEIRHHLADGRRGERLRDGFHVTIIGPPNAGKSSLLNVLAQRDAAIVAATAGTTRDVVEVHLDLGGYPLVLADTAGLRPGPAAGGEAGEEQSGDEVEAEGVRRARARAEECDLKLAVFDGETWPRADPSTAELVDENTLVVINKSDLGLTPLPVEINGRPAFAISVRENQGIDRLVASLEKEIASRMEAGGGQSLGGVALSRARHRQSLEECAACLDRCIKAAAAELAAEDLRLAVRALGRITGRVNVDDLLDAIFRDFCIGK